MAIIYVKTKEGRRAYYAGKAIPHDHTVPVPDNDPFIQRMLYHWEDIEQEGGATTPAATTAKSVNKQVTEMGPTPRPAPGPRERLQPTGEQAPGTGAPRPQN